MFRIHSSASDAASQVTPKTKTVQIAEQLLEGEMFCLTSFFLHILYINSSPIRTMS